jgi:hypothetical protein
VSLLEEEETPGGSPQVKDHKRTHEEGGYLQAVERGLIRNQPANTFIMGLQTPNSDKINLFEPVCSILLQKRWQTYTGFSIFFGTVI